MKMLKSKYARGAAAVGVAVTAAAFAGSSPASAAGGTWGHCPYPYVCFYKANPYNGASPVAEFKDITSGWQNLGSKSHGAPYLYDSRHDDRVRVHFTNGDVACFNPGWVGLLYTWGTADKVQIQNASSC